MPRSLHPTQLRPAQPHGPEALAPDLRQEQFTAEKLDSQLDDQSSTLLNNPAKGVRLSGNEAEVTKIFDWFGEDFEKLDGVEAFIRHYVSLPANVELDGYLSYNWSVNGE